VGKDEFFGVNSILDLDSEMSGIILDSRDDSRRQKQLRKCFYVLTCKCAYLGRSPNPSGRRPHPRRGVNVN
jgi:hypothetical protein